MDIHTTRSKGLPFGRGLSRSGGLPKGKAHLQHKGGLNRGKAHPAWTRAVNNEENTQQAVSEGGAPASASPVPSPSAPPGEDKGEKQASAPPVPKPSAPPFNPNVGSAPDAHPVNPFMRHNVGSSAPPTLTNQQRAYNKAAAATVKAGGFAFTMS
jgi:hypothetical protein